VTMTGANYKRIGHKGADAIVPGNTIESFRAAVEHGVEMIEFDVLRDREGRLVVAHDYDDADTRRPLGLADALDAFLEPPLDRVELNCDLKLPGREAELAGVLEGHGLLERSRVSTMEISSLVKLRRLVPELSLGWTVPKTRRDWTSPWAAPVLFSALLVMRRRMPRTIETRAPELGVNSVWAYHRLVTPRLVEAAREAGVELFAWTVDDADRIAALEALGIGGIVSNDPRLFRPPPSEQPEKPEKGGRGSRGSSQRGGSGKGKGAQAGKAGEAEPAPESS
jgi:glycerophosphoryl diester phosphodiesterase